MALDYEQLQITSELGEVIRLHNQALEQLRAFRQAYPYLMAPNIFSMAEENLKDNVQVLYRELNNLHKPAGEKKRYFCKECHDVYFTALPGGLCDQCRSKLSSSSSRPAYLSHRITPESEATTVADFTPDPTAYGRETSPAEFQSMDSEIVDEQNESASSDVQEAESP